MSARSWTKALKPSNNKDENKIELTHKILSKVECPEESCMATCNREMARRSDVRVIEHTPKDQRY